MSNSFVGKEGGIDETRSLLLRSMPFFSGHLSDPGTEEKKKKEKDTKKKWKSKARKKEDNVVCVCVCVLYHEGIDMFLLGKEGAVPDLLEFGPG